MGNGVRMQPREEGGNGMVWMGVWEVGGGGWYLYQPVHFVTVLPPPIPYDKKSLCYHGEPGYQPLTDNVKILSVEYLTNLISVFQLLTISENNTDIIIVILIFFKTRLKNPEFLIIV